MKNSLKLAILLAAVAISAPAAQAKDWLASDFGAKADGITLNTASIQAAIDFASRNGGGRVVLTPGEYVCGSIYIKEGVTLHIEEGATLLGSLNPWDYIKDPVAGWTAFVFSVQQDNVGITGKGTIDNRGFEVANNMVQYIHLGLFNDALRWDRPQEQNRPENVHFYKCNNVVIKDVTMKNPACWNQQYDCCRNLLIEGIKVDAKAYWNNDGLDVVDCQDVVVRNCFIDSTDDSYCFKSHRADGVSENILVEDCVGRSSANGIKFGTMTLGSFKHFLFKNITIYDTYRSAIEIASVDGGQVEDIVVDGLKSLHTGNPIFIRMGVRRAITGVPCVKDIVIRNVYAEVPFEKPDAGYNYEGPVEDLPRNVCPSAVLGIPGHRIENVLLENIELVYPGKADKDYAYRGCSPAELAAIEELEKSYPEFSNWKEMPAWGFYMRHADGVELVNVKLTVKDVDYRPAIVCDDMVGLRLKDVTVNQADADKKKVQTVLNNVKKLKKK